MQALPSRTKSFFCWMMYVSGHIVWYKGASRVRSKLYGGHVSDDSSCLSTRGANPDGLEDGDPEHGSDRSEILPRHIIDTEYCIWFRPVELHAQTFIL